MEDKELSMIPKFGYIEEDEQVEHRTKSGEIEKQTDWEGFFKRDERDEAEKELVMEQVCRMSDDDMTEIQVLINAEINFIRGFLLEKNRKYGNSALEPIRVFSKADPIEQLRVRIDDKIKRITTCQADDEEDSILDLIGYLILLRVAKHQE